MFPRRDLVPASRECSRSWMFGAGRERKEDDIDPGVGISIQAKVGDAVAAGDAVGTVRYNTDAQLAACLPILETAWIVTEEPQSARPLILGEVK